MSVSDPFVRGRSQIYACAVKIKGLRVFPASGRDLARTLWICLMILVGFVAVASLLMFVGFIIEGQGLPPLGL